MGELGAPPLAAETGATVMCTDSCATCKGTTEWMCQWEPKRPILGSGGTESGSGHHQQADPDPYSWDGSKVKRGRQPRLPSGIHRWITSLRSE